MEVLPPKKSVNQKVNLPFLEKAGVELYIKREDLLHQHISGNKYRKLFYNLIQARREGHHTLLTFGGAFSNHIAATAYAARLAGMKSIGVIRGDELGKDLQETLKENPTLRFAASQGMQLHFVSRRDYRKKTEPSFIEHLHDLFGDFYLVPEGGTNLLAVKGAAEILTQNDQTFDVITCAVGTGGTIAGIINASFLHQQILGFPALKENYLENNIKKYTAKTNWQLIRDYHLGGFAKVSPELIRFINDFHGRTNILLDPVYTAKMMMGLQNMIKKGFFPRGTKILAVHTGGLQGIDGMNIHLKKKGLPLIQTAFYQD